MGTSTMDLSNVTSVGAALTGKISEFSTTAGPIVLIVTGLVLAISLVTFGQRRVSGALHGRK